MKPLSKERREVMLRSFENGWYLGEYVEELLAAEQYWREQVRSVTPDPFLVETGRSVTYCLWCGHRNDSMDKREHKPDCAWVLSQEGK